MSLRPEISGFDLARMRSYLGCGDPELAARAMARARERCGTDVEVEAHVRDIVLGTVTPDADLVEKAPFVAAVVSLAFFEQGHLPTDSNAWKNAHLDLWLELPDQPPPGVDRTAWADAYELMGWALVQRPLFGGSEDSDWTTYGYLTHDEVRRLLGYRDLLLDAREEAGDEDFASDFFGWLAEIAEAGLDYWFYAE